MNVEPSTISINKRVDSFLKAVGIDSKKTAKEYRWRLGNFDSFLKQSGTNSIEQFFDKLATKELDVYDTMTDFHFYLKDQGLKPASIACKLSTVKTFLEFNDVPINNSKFRLRVRTPKRVRNTEIQALSKELVRKIILEIKHNMRLQTYVLLLAATGMRATEALSIRVSDIDWKNKRVRIREEYTKTKTGRYALLTEECINQLKSWMQYRQRERKIVLFGGKRTIKLKREFKPTDLIFSSGHYNAVTKPHGMYGHMADEFMKVLKERFGLVEQEDGLGRRHTITLHSFRRFVKSTISDLGFSEYSEWFIGHIGSTYYRTGQNQTEIMRIFEKVEPYLTYLDYDSLEANSADIKTQLEEAKQQIEQLKKQLKGKGNEMDEMKQEFREELEMFKKNLKDQLVEQFRGRLIDADDRDRDRDDRA
jgi:integrase